MNKPTAALPRERKRRLYRLSLPRTLDRRGGLRAATLLFAEGVDPKRLPELCACHIPTPVALDLAGRPTGMAALDGRLYITTQSGTEAFFHCFRDGILLSRVAFTPTAGEDAAREILQFNLYSDPTDPLGGEYAHMGLLFPEGLYFPLDTDTPSLCELSDKFGMPIPGIERACVFLSRVFGVAGDRLYASAYNDPQNWNVDTATDTGAANAWAATVQSNTEASGDFRALTVFAGEVLAFKDGFCHVISGTKNPFRVGDLLSVGAACPRSVAEVGGKLFFADKKQIYRYNGDSLSPIGDALATEDLSGAVGCAGDGVYYLFLPAAGELFAYAVETGAWSSLGRVCGDSELSFMSRSAEGGALLLDSDGLLYTLNGTGERRFACTFAPIVEDGEATMRIARLVLSLSCEAGSEIRAVFRDFSGRERVLLDGKIKEGGFCRLVSRIFTPADRGGYLSLAGRGDITVQRIELMTETQE